MGLLDGLFVCGAYALCCLVTVGSNGWIEGINKAIEAGGCVMMSFAEGLLFRQQPSICLFLDCLDDQEQQLGSFTLTRSDP